MQIVLKSVIVSAMALLSVSCWREDVPEADFSRQKVGNLKAVPGDEEVLLSWTMPEGWAPKDYIVKYKDEDSREISFNSNAELSYNITGLKNDLEYSFTVQALYIDNGMERLSGTAKVSAKPATSRFSVKDLEADAGDQQMTLIWTRPSASVSGYAISYYKEGAENEIKTVDVGADAEEYTIEGLANDINYYFSIVAKYKKGDSEPVVIKAMPALAVPYILDRTSAASGQPIHFRFNTEDYPAATDIIWDFPDGKQLKGADVYYGIKGIGVQKVILKATVRDKVKTWNFDITLREYVVYANDWVGTPYNGFKGSCPVFSPDGSTVYNITFGKGGSVLYAFDIITGNEKWRYEPAKVSGSYNMATVNPETGDIYYGTTTAGQFYAVTSEGKLKWEFSGAQSMKSAAPAVSTDGTVVYVGDGSGNIFALDAATGSEKWHYTGPAGMVAGLLVNGDELVAGFNYSGDTVVGDVIQFINTATGQKISGFTLPGSMTDLSGFAVAADKKTVYVPCRSGLLCSIDIAEQKLLKTLSVGTNILYEPVVAPNGSVFLGSKDSKTYCISGDLSKVLWSHTLPEVSSNGYNYSHPCVDSENRFYITSGGKGNTSFIFGATGDVIDSWSYPGNSNAQKQMGGNNYIDGIFFSAFIGAGDENGIFVGKYVGGERALSWSSHGGDICGSCCIK